MVVSNRRVGGKERRRPRGSGPEAPATQHLFNWGLWSIPGADQLPRRRRDRVGASPRASEFPAFDDEVLVPDRSIGEPALEDLARAGGVASLGRERRSRHV